MAGIQIYARSVTARSWRELAGAGGCLEGERGTSEGSISITAALQQAAYCNTIIEYLFYIFARVNLRELHLYTTYLYEGEARKEEGSKEHHHCLLRCFRPRVIIPFLLESRLESSKAASDS